MLRSWEEQPLELGTGSHRIHCGRRILALPGSFGDHGTIAFVTVGISAGAMLDAPGLGFRGQTIRILAEVQAE
jgi:hypothetical protein